MGWLADRFAKKYVMLLTYLLVAPDSISIPGAAVGMYCPAAAVFGVGLGGDYMIIPLVTAEFSDQVLGGSWA